MAGWKKKKKEDDTCICMPTYLHFRYRDTQEAKSEGM